MKDRPDGVHDSDVLTALADGWGIEARSVGYRPVGFGGYHWSAVDDDGREWFVTVDDLGHDDPTRRSRFTTLGRAYGTASALHRDAGLEFVVAPVPTRAGTALRRLTDQYAMTVFPLVHGEAGRFGPHRPDDLPELLRLLAGLHRATPVVAADAPRTELVLPCRDALDAALHDLDPEWTGGPYAEVTRRLLAEHADRVRGMLAEFDRLVDRIGDAGWVVTHGEPHPGNVIRTPTGLRLVDWDTVRLAPPERDLWMLTSAFGGSDDVLDDYARATGRPATRPPSPCTGCAGTWPTSPATSRSSAGHTAPARTPPTRGRT